MLMLNQIEAGPDGDEYLFTFKRPLEEYEAVMRKTCLSALLCNGNPISWQVSGNNSPYKGRLAGRP